MKSQSTAARTPVLYHIVSQISEKSLILPLQRRYAHDVQASNPFALGIIIHPSSRAFQLALLPVLIILPDFFNRQTLWAILFVSQKQ